MPTQLALPGFGLAPERPMASGARRQREHKLAHSLFFALFPPAADAAHIAKRAEDLRRQHRLSGDLIEAGRLHVTLHSLGSHADAAPRAVVDAAMAAAATVASPSFEMVFDRVLSFAGNGAFVMRVADATAAPTAFRQRLGSAILQAGLSAKPSRLAHMTLLYDQIGVAERTIEPVQWTATEFVLVHSLVGKKRHEWLGKWPLRTVPELDPISRLRAAPEESIESHGV